MDETRNEEVLIKKVFHLTVKENIKKTREAVTPKYCETVCVKILTLRGLTGTVQKMIKNWEKVVLIILKF